jgi:hypothetical protein
VETKFMGCVNITLFGGGRGECKEGIRGRGVEWELSRFDYEAFEIGFSLVGFIRLLAAAILLRLCADVKDSNHLIFCTIQIFFQ